MQYVSFPSYNISAANTSCNTFYGRYQLFSFASCCCDTIQPFLLSLAISMLIFMIASSLFVNITYVTRYATLVKITKKPQQFTIQNFFVPCFVLQPLERWCSASYDSYPYVFLCCIWCILPIKLKIPLEEFRIFDTSKIGKNNRIFSHFETKSEKYDEDWWRWCSARKKYLHNVIIQRITVEKIYFSEFLFGNRRFKLPMFFPWRYIK